MKKAVIDIGSNSVRLLVCEGRPVHDKTVVTTRLGENLSLTGRLSACAIERTAAAVLGLKREAEERGADEIFVFATEAVRSAENGMDFVERVKEKANVAVDVIDGDTEAQIGFLGACSGTDFPSAVLDIGGASTELVAGCGREIFYRKSLPVGVVRLHDLYGDDADKTADHVKAAAADYGTPPPFERLVGIGGTATSLAFMHLKLPVYEAEKIHGCRLTLSDLYTLKGYILGGGDLSMLPKKRAEVIGCGACELIEIMKYVNAAEITISETDNLEGYLMYKNL